ncbi:MAG: LacI family DNA-binding transcriptional regulator [Leucobacter sp.]
MRGNTGPPGPSGETAAARLSDVAAAAGVSIKTVSRVINDEPSVLPTTRERVDAAVLRLGYVPNGMARSLKTGSQQAIGVLVDSIADPFFAEIVSVIEGLALNHGLSVLSASTGISAGREREQLHRLAGSGVRGIIAAPTADGDAEMQQLRKRLPIVCVDRTVDGLDGVVVNDLEATASAVGGFISAGHTRIAFLGREDYQPRTVGRRLEGYRAALSDAGLRFDPALVVTTARSREEMAAAVHELLGSDEAPTALFCSSGRTARAAIDALRSGGHVDIACISFGDLELASALTPALSCIDHDPKAVATRAFERLMELLEAPRSGPQEVVVPVSYIPRGSGELPPKTRTRRGN